MKLEKFIKKLDFLDMFAILYKNRIGKINYNVTSHKCCIEMELEILLKVVYAPKTAN